MQWKAELQARQLQIGMQRIVILDLHRDLELAQIRICLLEAQVAGDRELVDFVTWVYDGCLQYLERFGLLSAEHQEQRAKQLDLALVNIR